MPPKAPTLVHIITTMDLGGAQRATLDQIMGVPFTTHRRVLITGESRDGSGGLLAEAKNASGLEVVCLPSLQRDISLVQDARALRRIVSTLNTLQKDNPRLWVHTHSSKAGILGRLAAKAVGAERIIHSIHGFGHRHHGHGGKRLAFALAEKICGQLTHGFTADSAANIHQGATDGLIGRHPCAVVHCGIGLQDYGAPAQGRAKAKEGLGLAPDQVVVLSLAPLKPQKAPLDWLAVAMKVRQQNPKVVFLLAGDGPLRHAVEANIPAAQREHIRLLGWRRDVPKLLAAADIFLLTSHWEGLPQSFAQAMAAGLPIIATHVDGAPEAVVHGANGLLLPPGDVPSIANAVLHLASDAKERQRMGERAQQMLAPLTKESMLRVLARFYDALGAGKNQNHTKTPA